MLTRPLTAFLSIAGGAVSPSPVLLPLTAALVKPLVRPVTNLYLDIAEEMGGDRGRTAEAETMYRGQREEGSEKEPVDQHEKETEAGTAILDKVGKIL